MIGTFVTSPLGLVVLLALLVLGLWLAGLGDRRERQRENRGDYAQVLRALIETETRLVEVRHEHARAMRTLQEHELVLEALGLSAEQLAQLAGELAPLSPVDRRCYGTARVISVAMDALVQRPGLTFWGRISSPPEDHIVRASTIRNLLLCLALDLRERLRTRGAHEEG